MHQWIFFEYLSFCAFWDHSEPIRFCDLNATSQGSTGLIFTELTAVFLFLAIWFQMESFSHCCMVIIMTEKMQKLDFIWKLWSNYEMPTAVDVCCKTFGK